MCVCMYACMHACIQTCMCMYVCMYVERSGSVVGCLVRDAEGPRVRASHASLYCVLELDPLILV